jgi:hypothetical protein
MVAILWVADRPAGGWSPRGRIIMTPYRPHNYYLFSVCLIMASPASVKSSQSNPMSLKIICLVLSLPLAQDFFIKIIFEFRFYQKLLLLTSIN